MIKFNFIKCSESYYSESAKHGVQKSTKGKRAFEGGREACLFYQQYQCRNVQHSTKNVYDRKSFEQILFNSTNLRNCIRNGSLKYI